MRLIDADKLIEEINNLGWRLYDTLTLKGLSIALETIKEQPTAFDVEKVVSELEDYKMWKELLIYDLDFRERQIIKKAIEIAKRGGIDE